MANIELVIKLNDDIVQGIIDGENDTPRNIVRSFQATIADAIKNGIPLPKGHGRIIDIGQYEGKVIASRKYCGVVKLVEVAELDTIIEADKAESEN